MTQNLISLSGSCSHQTLDFSSASIQELISEGSAATVFCRAVSGLLDPSGFLGKTLCLAFETRHAAPRYFDGVIVQMELVSMGERGQCVYRLELRSWTSLLSRNQDFRVYQQCNAIDVVREVIGRHAHSSVRFEDRTTGTPRVWDYCVQFGESDLNFVQRILEQEGIYFFFEHGADQHTLILADSNVTHQPCPGYETLRVDFASQQGRLGQHEVINSLSVCHGIEPPRHAHTDYNFKTPRESLLQGSAGAMSLFNQQMEVFEYPGRFENAVQGLAYSTVRHQEALARACVYLANTSARGVCAGHVLTTSCLGNAALDGKTLLITSTRIGLTQASSDASDSVSSSLVCQFEGIELTEQYRPARRTPKPHAKGPLPALVVGPPGREIHTDEHGRIKVQFHWDRQGKRDENSSCWIRLAFPVAGKGWGMVSIPRIGQEVLVSFEDGDPDRPVVTGVCYNAEHHVPYALPDNQTVSGWKTRSSPDGEPTHFNELRFEDKRGEEYVRLQAERDYMALIKQQSQLEIGADSHLLIHGSLIEEIKKDVSRTVLGSVMQHIQQSLHLSVDDDCLATVQGTLGLTSAAGVSVSTNGACALKAGGSTDIQSTGNLNQSSLAALNLSAASAMRLSVGSSSITLSPAGVFINGPVVSINGAGGGVAKSATPSSPDVPMQPVPVVPPIDPLA